MDPQPRNPLHGITLSQLLEELVAAYGWEELGRQVRLQCFLNEPSVPSSLKFLRRTPLGAGAAGGVLPLAPPRVSASGAGVLTRQVKTG